MHSKGPKVNPGSSLVDVIGEIPVCGIIFVHSDSKHATLTREAADALGLPDPGEDSVPLAALPASLSAIARGLLSGDKSQTEELLEIPVPGKGIARLRVTGRRPDRQGGYVVLVLNNLGSTRQLEQHLQKMARLATIGTLSASMAHEIKNALVAGKTFIDLLLERHQDEELVEIVRRELGRIDVLVSETLRFAKHGKPHFTALRLHDVLAHSLRLIQPQLESKLISVSHTFQASPDLVSGDDHQLQQAFVNLFLNAAEAMGPNGKLTVLTQSVPARSKEAAQDLPEPAQLRITIQDTGIGIPSETLAHLFEPFFTTKASGTGLGLPITWRIIQEHRGTITVDSQVGSGTSFFILLPALSIPD